MAHMWVQLVTCVASDTHTHCYAQLQRFVQCMPTAHYDHVCCQAQGCMQLCISFGAWGTIKAGRSLWQLLYSPPDATPVLHHILHQHLHQVADH
jgi:hypothetical protein